MKKNWLRAHPVQLGGLAAQAESSPQVYGEKMCILSAVLDGLVSRGAVCGHSLGTGPSLQGNATAELRHHQPARASNSHPLPGSSSSWCRSTSPPLLQCFVGSHRQPWVATQPLSGSYPSRQWDLSMGKRRKAASTAFSFLSPVHSGRLTQLLQRSHTSQDTRVKKHWMSRGAWAA